MPTQLAPLTPARAVTVSAAVYGAKKRQAHADQILSLMQADQFLYRSDVRADVPAHLGRRRLPIEQQGISETGYRYTKKENEARYR